MKIELNNQLSCLQITSFINCQLIIGFLCCYWKQIPGNPKQSCIWKSEIIASSQTCLYCLYIFAHYSLHFCQLYICLFCKNITGFMTLVSPRMLYPINRLIPDRLLLKPLWIILFTVKQYTSCLNCFLVIQQFSFKSSCLFYLCII